MIPLQGLSSQPEPKSSKKQVPHHIQEQLHALQVQDSLLCEYMESAQKTRNLDDMASLRQSQEEIRAEIARLKQE
jgi:hypothetical protein